MNLPKELQQIVDASHMLDMGFIYSGKDVRHYRFTHKTDELIQIYLGMTSDGDVGDIIMRKIKDSSSIGARVNDVLSLLSKLYEWKLVAAKAHMRNLKIDTLLNPVAS